MQKTKSLQNIENRLSDLDPGSFRFKALECARDFKTSWIELGQYLFTIYKDKLYKDWGYLEFDSYCAKEVGIRKNTALKLLKSYSFIEKEEPSFLKREEIEDRQPARIPSYEAVNSLRLAKQNEQLPEKEYRALRDDVFENTKEDEEVKKKIKYVLKNYAKPAKEQDPEEKKDTVLKRALFQLKAAKAEMEELGFPKKVTHSIADLIDLLSEYQV